MYLKFGDLCIARNLKYLPVASVLLKVLKGKNGFVFLHSKILVLYVQRKSETVFFMRILKAKKYYE